MRKRIKKERPILGELITRPQFAEMAGVTVPTLRRRLAKLGELAPQPVNYGGTLTKYSRLEVEAFLTKGPLWRVLGASASPAVGAGAQA